MSSDLIGRGGLAGMVGGALWALTPLRQPLLGGRFPEHPVFRPYNLVLLVIALLLAAGLLALHVRYKGGYGRLGTAGVVVVFVGYVMLFLGSLPAVVLSPDGSRELILAGQDLGFLGALVAGVGAVLLGIALLRTRPVPRARPHAGAFAGALLLIVALPVGLAGVILVSGLGFVNIAGLPLTVLYGGAWIVLGGHLRSQGLQGSATAEQPSRVI